MKFHTLIGFSLVCLLGCGAAEEEEDDSDIDVVQQELAFVTKRMCEDPSMWEPKWEAGMACQAKAAPELTATIDKCFAEETNLGSSTGVEKFKYLCDSANKEMLKKVQACVKATRVKTDKANMKACLGKK